MLHFKRRNFMAMAGSTIVFGCATPSIAKPAKPKIKVGQIGTSHAHASGKMATMRKLSDQFEVVGIVELDAARRKAMANHKSYRDLKWMSEEELLNTRGLQAVAVETDVKNLVPTATRVAKAGLHMHLDKPAGTALPAFRTLVDEVTKQKRTLQMGYMLRYNPAFQLCYKAVREGWLGDVFELHTVMSKTVSDGARKKLAKFPGGSMFELGCHIIDSAVYVLGKPTKVTAHIRKTKPDQDKLADNCLAVLEYPKATATIRSALVEYDGFKRRQFVVCGDQGTVDIRPLEPPKMLLALSKARDGFKKGYQEVALTRSSGRYDGEFIDLANIIRGEKQPDFSAEHDLAVHETLLRASGMPVN